MIRRKELDSRSTARSTHASKEGLLHVPKGVPILHGEPGILYQVKAKNSEKKFLFIKPPLHKKSFYETATEEAVEIAPERTQTLLHLHSKTQATESILVDHTFTAVDEVIARSFEYPDPKNPQQMIKHPFLLQVATFERVGTKRPDMPESGNEIKVKQLGYMYKQDLKKIERFKKTKESLFPYPPTLSDIHQAGMGDCFLLSTLGAILNSKLGAKRIMQMMKQQPDGSTLVKLFHPVSLEPMYVRVENTEHYFKTGRAVRHKAPWVHMLEKAYSAIGYAHYTEGEKYQAVNFTKEGEQYGLKPQSFLSVYGDGGRPEMAMRILTGGEAEELDLHLSALREGTSHNPFNAESLTLTSGGHLATEILSYLHPQALEIAEEDISRMQAELEKTHQMLDESTDQTSTQTLDTRIETLELELARLNKKKQDIPTLAATLPSEEELVTNPQRIKSFQKKLHKLLIEANFTDYLQSDAWKTSSIFAALAKDANLILSWLIYVNLLSIRYPDTYQQWQEIISPIGNEFEEYAPKNRTEVEGMLQKLATLIPPPPKSVLQQLTHYINQTSTDEKNHTLYLFSGELGHGEYTQLEYNIFERLKAYQTQNRLLVASTPEEYGRESVPGLRAKHAYTILDVFTKTVDGRELMFVRLHNPWGRVGRLYNTQAGVMQPYESETVATFELEMTDFLSHFKRISIGIRPTLHYVHAAGTSTVIASFTNLTKDEQFPFLQRLSSQSKSEQIKFLRTQSLADLYEIISILEKEITQHRFRLQNFSAHPLLQAEKGSLERLQTLLTHAKPVFNQLMAHSNELATIKQHANDYLYSRAANLAPKKLGPAKQGLFKTRTLNYLQLYHYHTDFLSQQKAKDLFIKDFSSLNLKEQAMFIALLLKQPKKMQLKVLTAQTNNNLQALHDTCMRLHTQHEESEQYLVLANRIEHLEQDSLERIQQHAIVHYGVEADTAVETLAYLYLKDHAAPSQQFNEDQLKDLALAQMAEENHTRLKNLLSTRRGKSVNDSKIPTHKGYSLG